MRVMQERLTINWYRKVIFSVL